MPKICCFFENLDVDYFMYTILQSNFKWATHLAAYLVIHDSSQFTPSWRILHHLRTFPTSTDRAFRPRRICGYTLKQSDHIREIVLKVGTGHSKSRVTKSFSKMGMVILTAEWPDLWTSSQCYNQARVTTFLQNRDWSFWKECDQICETLLKVGTGFSVDHLS